MAREAGSIPSNAGAFLFAASCIAFAARAGISAAVRAASPSSVDHADAHRATRPIMLTGRGVTLACAFISTALGLVYLATAGAPSRMIAMNAMAFLAGLILVLPLSGREPADSRFFGFLAIAAGAVLVITALLGQQASGAARWVSIGQVVLQPSLILLPLLIISFARSQDGLTACGVAMAAVALALQPDKAMAGALLAGLVAVTVFTRNALTRLCVLMAALSLFVTSLAPDVVPATPFVDRVFRTAFSSGVVPGVAAWLGATLLALPAVLGVILDRAHRPIHAAFGAVWSTITLAAMLADYPAPLVGYGGSAIVGYILGALALPRRWEASSEAVKLVEADQGETGIGLLRPVCET